MPRPRKTPPPPQLVLQFLIVLSRVTPLVWRRIQVPVSYSFWDLHVAIQDAMGWQDCHLHEFTLTVLPPPRQEHPFGRSRREIPAGTRHIGIPVDEFVGERETVPGWTMPLLDVVDAPHPNLPLRYEYDFGDGWEHVVLFEGHVDAEPGAYPRCVDGQNRCPPEDCGGPGGYAELLAAVTSTRRSAEQRERVEWAGGPFDPHEFDPAAVRFDDPKKRWKRAFENA